MFGNWKNTPWAFSNHRCLILAILVREAPLAFGIEPVSQGKIFSYTPATGKKDIKTNININTPIFWKWAVGTFFVVRFAKGCRDSMQKVSLREGFLQQNQCIQGFACLEFWAKRSELAESLVERRIWKGEFGWEILDGKVGLLGGGWSWWVFFGKLVFFWGFFSEQTSTGPGRRVWTLHLQRQLKCFWLKTGSFPQHKQQSIRSRNYRYIILYTVYQHIKLNNHNTMSLVSSHHLIHYTSQKQRHQLTQQHLKKHMPLYRIVLKHMSKEIRRPFVEGFMQDPRRNQLCICHQPKLTLHLLNNSRASNPFFFSGSRFFWADTLGCAVSFRLSLQICTAPSEMAPRFK